MQKVITDNINGYERSKSFTKIGFAFDNLGPSQSTYLSIVSSNKWLSKNFDTNISIFFQNQEMPCMPISFARFHIKDCVHFDGNLIASSFDTLQSISKATKSKLYYYIQDVEWERGWFKHSKDDIDNSLRNNSIIKLFRSQDLYDYINNDSFNLPRLIVEDYDINSILEIINDNR
jgi:hypothetical protein